MTDAAGAVVLVGRLVFGLYFALLAGLSFHVKMSGMAEGYAKQMKFPLPGLAGWPTGLWLFAGGISIALGIWPDLGALMIIAFLIPAALYFHRFWEVEDQMQQQQAMLLFWRNAYTVGTLLVLFGAFVALGSELRFAVTGPLFDF
ncbi:MAG: DoxX family protein [Actinomycetota bacterium]